MLLPLPRAVGPSTLSNPRQISYTSGITVAMLRRGNLNTRSSASYCVEVSKRRRRNLRTSSRQHDCPLSAQSGFSGYSTYSIISEYSRPYLLASSDMRTHETDHKARVLWSDEVRYQGKYKSLVDL